MRSGFRGTSRKDGPDRALPALLCRPNQRLANDPYDRSELRQDYIQDKDRLTRYSNNRDLMRVNHSRSEEEHLGRYLF